MKRWLWVLALALIAACQPKPTVSVLPTLMEVNAVATSAGTAEAAATQAGPTSTSALPTLPPTWTASPPPTQRPTETPPAASSPASAASSLTGTIAYLYNGKSIVALSAANQTEKLILNGGAPAALTLSPDGKLLAYVAQGNGSAREAYIINLDGSYNQRVSCLGFARVIAPAWSPDSQTLAFAASQTANGPLGIYTAKVAGAGQCPSGNGQRLVTQTEFNDLTDMNWTSDGNVIVFSSQVIYALDVAKGMLYPPLTQFYGYGPDFSLAPNPRSTLLVYLKLVYDRKAKTTVGQIYQIDTANLQNPMQELGGANYATRSLRWSADGSRLLVGTDSDIWVQDSQNGTSLQALKGSKFVPQPAFSPDAASIAYIDGAPDKPTVQQIFVVSSLGGTPVQLTSHTEGTMSDLYWAPG
jgi:Tol biopolymer transport system component